MSLHFLNRQHLKLISLYSGRYAMRGGTGIIFAVLVLVCGLLIAHIFVSPVEMQKKRIKSDMGLEIEDRKILEDLVDIARPGVRWALGGGEVHEEGEEKNKAMERTEKWTSYLLDTRPAMLSAIFLVMIFILPFLVALGAFNQFSGDIGSRGLRYHLLRTERPNIFFGRFLGTALFSILIMVFLLLVIILYIGFKLHVYAWPDLFTWGLRGLIAFALVCLPYVALCSWMSASMDSPFLSLIFCNLIVGVVPLFSKIGSLTWEPASNVKYVLPWGIHNYLLHHNLLVVLGAAAACLGYTALFLFLGHRHFQKRDL